MEKHVISAKARKSEVIVLDADEEAAVQAEWDAWEPTVEPPAVHPLDFLERFTPEEEDAIDAAAVNDAGLRRWLRRLHTATKVTLTDDRTVAGMQALVDAGLITSARRDEILTP